MFTRVKRRVLGMLPQRCQLVFNQEQFGAYRMLLTRTLMPV